MRCPKCHYISFDGGERCRNCGYDFSLAIESADNDFALSEEPEGPLVDASLKEPVDLDGALARQIHESGAPEAESAANSPAQASSTSSGEFDLPLFHAGEGPQLVAPPVTPPRPPLAVRRATPGLPRARPQPSEPPPRLQLDAEPEPADMEPAARPASTTALRAAISAGAESASAGRRAAAALVDIAIVAGIDLAVLHFTLQLSDLAWTDLGMLPWIPMAIFLSVLDGGYAVAFTASVGQTVGKMAAGIRVESDGPGDGRPTPAQALVRAAFYLVSAVPFGLGFFVAIVGDDRRALHDRLAGTRVVNLH